MGRVDTRNLRPTYALEPGEVVVELGPHRASLSHCAFSRLFAAGPEEEPFRPDLGESLDIFKRVEKARDLGLLDSIHDVADGGLLVALVEMLFVHALGASLRWDGEDLSPLFGEGCSSFVALTPPQKLPHLKEVMGTYLRVWGEVNDSGRVTLETPSGAFRGETLDYYQSWQRGAGYA